MSQKLLLQELFEVICKNFLTREKSFCAVCKTEMQTKTAVFVFPNASGVLCAACAAQAFHAMAANHAGKGLGDERSRQAERSRKMLYRASMRQIALRLGTKKNPVT